MSVANGFWGKWKKDKKTLENKKNWGKESKDEPSFEGAYRGNLWEAWEFRKPKSELGKWPTWR